MPSLHFPIAHRSLIIVDLSGTFEKGVLDENEDALSKTWHVNSGV